MKKIAEKMFKEIGFEREIIKHYDLEGEYNIYIYTREDGIILDLITFSTRRKEFDAYRFDRKNANVMIMQIGKDELAAINKQCEELDWNLN